MDKLMDLIKKNAKVILIASFVGIILIPIFIWGAYFIGRTFGGIATDISADGLISYIAGIFGAIGTIFIGWIAYWEQKRTILLIGYLCSKKSRVYLILF